MCLPASWKPPGKKKKKKKKARQESHGNICHAPGFLSSTQRLLSSPFENWENWVSDRLIYWRKSHDRKGIWSEVADLCCVFMEEVSKHTTPLLLGTMPSSPQFVVCEPLLVRTHSPRCHSTGLSHFQRQLKRLTKKFKTHEAMKQ